MSLRISLDNPPPFFTNLDVVSGRVVLSLVHPEQVGAIVVKLEGEARTAIGAPTPWFDQAQSNRRPTNTIPGDLKGASGALDTREMHKILYKVSQVFPDMTVPAVAVPAVLQPGQHAFPFRFKFPFNNACSDPTSMARIGGLAGAGGFANGPALFGLGGIRVMDGSRQLMYPHITRTLPPSFSGCAPAAEIRYYLKVTIQRPGLLKENWRQQLNLRFLPIEPPRPPNTAQEAYARRPFTFPPLSPSLAMDGSGRRRSSFFGNIKPQKPAGPAEAPSELPSADAKAARTAPDLAPSIEISARLPHPPILTCHQPIPLRLIAKKLVGSRQVVYLTSLQIELHGLTHIRCEGNDDTLKSKWPIVDRADLVIPVCDAAAASGTELVLPNSIWSEQRVPKTVMPSFEACNIGREYQLEIKIGLSWNPSSPGGAQSSSIFTKSKDSAIPPKMILLPLHFRRVEVYSGLSPPPELLEAMSTADKKHKTQAQDAESSGSPFVRPPGPQLPPRRPSQPVTTGNAHQLYPPALRPGQAEPDYDDAPPSYDEAMADAVPSIDTEGRPEFSEEGVEKAAS